MTQTNLKNSVGVVSPQRAHFPEPLYLESGEVLDGFELIYETYGELSADGSNAVLVCHALSGNHHAAGFHSESDTKPGWWDTVIGPGKPIDTNRFLWCAPITLVAAMAPPGPAAYARRQESPGGLTSRKSPWQTGSKLRNDWLNTWIFGTGQRSLAEV